MPVQDGPAIFMQLTLDDTRVLRWVAASLTQPEIARKLGISVDTCETSGLESRAAYWHKNHAGT